MLYSEINLFLGDENAKTREIGLKGGSKQRLCYMDLFMVMYVVGIKYSVWACHVFLTFFTSI